MGFLKSVLLIVLGTSLVMLGLGNMVPVDLYLLPGKVAGSEPVLRGVPLAAVVVVSILFGIVIGQLMEWRRGRKIRRNAHDNARELARLRGKLDEVREVYPDPDDELPKAPAP